MTPIYDGLLALITLAIPLMILLSFPLAFGIAKSLHALVCQSEQEDLVKELKWIIKQLAILILPFTFAVFAATILTVNSTQQRWISSSTTILTYHSAGVILFAFIPGVAIAFRDLMQGKNNRVRPVGLWLGSLWALLYLSVAAQFYAYYIG